MRSVVIHPKEKRPKLERTAQRDAQLSGFLSYDLEMMLSDRHPQEQEWRSARRQYAAIPRVPFRNTPVPDAPNVEVPLGAIAADAINAQMVATLYSGSPLLTARAQDKIWVDAAKAAQRWYNYVAEQETKLRSATDNAFLDCIQLGTAGYYVPFTERVRKHRVHEVTSRGPQIVPLAPENMLFVGGSRGNIQEDRWAALRWWYSPGELQLYAKRVGWDIERLTPVAQVDWVRRQHELFGKTSSSISWREMFEIIEFYVYYDYNDDGEELDLLVYFDRTSQKVLDVQFNPYDERPIIPMVYQRRAQLAYGLGVMEMMRPLQEEATEIHNHRLLNMLIANSRVWAAVDGQVPESLEIWSNRVVPVRDINSLKELKMGDVYPSSFQAEISVTALAERRVGTEGMISSASRPSSIGTRTPGITAMTAMQEHNERFTPAFDEMRLATCEAVRQAVLRQRERILMGDSKVEMHMRSVLGDDADLVIDLLRQPDYGRYVQLEFTAVSPSNNREADRQAAVLMWNTMMSGYYKPAMEMLAAIAAPETPPLVLESAKKVVEAAGELADRFLRTFDQMRDPSRFILNLTPEIEAHQEQVQAQQGLAGLTQLLLGAVQGGGGAVPAENGAVPPEAAPAEPPLPV